LIPESDAYQHSLAQLQEPLTEVFHKFAETRQPRTSELVKGARAQGQTRVVTTGPEDCRRRNEKIAAGWEDVDAVAAKFDYLLREPFAVPHQPA
jgi:salicylate hydroxylase